MGDLDDIKNHKKEIIGHSICLTTLSWKENGLDLLIEQLQQLKKECNSSVFQIDLVSGYYNDIESVNIQAIKN